jgi:hypothetical protein
MMTIRIKVIQLCDKKSQFHILNEIKSFEGGYKNLRNVCRFFAN